MDEVSLRDFLSLLLFGFHLFIKFLCLDPPGNHTTQNPLYCLFSLQFPSDVVRAKDVKSSFFYISKFTTCLQIPSVRFNTSLLAGSVSCSNAICGKPPLLPVPQLLNSPHQLSFSHCAINAFIQFINVSLR